MGGRFWRNPETPERELNFQRKCSRRLGESRRADRGGPTIIIVIIIKVQQGLGEAPGPVGVPRYKEEEVSSGSVVACRGS